MHIYDSTKEFILFDTALRPTFQFERSKGPLKFIVRPMAAQKASVKNRQSSVYQYGSTPVRQRRAVSAADADTAATADAAAPITMTIPAAASIAPAPSKRSSPLLKISQLLRVTRIALPTSRVSGSFCVVKITGQFFYGLFGGCKG